MRVRAITNFLTVGRRVAREPLTATGLFARSARLAFEEAGWEVQSLRLAIQPLSALFGDEEARVALDFTRALEEAVRAEGLDYAALGPVVTADAPRLLDALPDMLDPDGNLFGSALVAGPGGAIDLPGAWRAARVVQRLSRARSDGFGNLFFATLANCPPGMPFFPAAYHDGGLSRFALAVETADAFVDAFSGAATLDEARRRLIETLEAQAQSLEAVARALEREHRFEFAGLDLSTATYPGAATSIAGAIERLTGVPVGQHATLFAAAFTTQALRAARFTRAGFSGLMLPVLEDSTLAERYGRGECTTADLLLYSAVCGTGLDVVPLPGDVTVDQLAVIILDVATLATVLNKPLTARLVPVPGKRAGDPTSFDFPYFANSTIMEPRAPVDARRLAEVCGVTTADRGPQTAGD